VAPGSDGNSIYYTVLGDSQVYRMDLGTGTTSVIHDFGASTIARDVHVVGTTLVAIVGGIVQFVTDPTLGPVQPDEGGVLTMVDLATGTETVLDADTRVVYRRPAISPDGSRVVVERYQVLSGTVVDRRADLYLFTLP
jgi:Tol biopolymer transport system component